MINFTLQITMIEILIFSVPVIDDDREAVDEIQLSENVTFGDTFDEKDSPRAEEVQEDRRRSMESRDSNSGPPSPASMEAAEKQIRDVPVTYRTMKRLGSKENEPRKKRTWGDSKKSIKPVIDNKTRIVSSSELKDIIPDIKPVLEEIKHEAEQKMETEEEDVTGWDTEKDTDVNSRSRQG